MLNALKEAVRAREAYLHAIADLAAHSQVARNPQVARDYMQARVNVIANRPDGYHGVTENDVAYLQACLARL